jgi:hypothetical protein
MYHLQTLTSLSTPALAETVHDLKPQCGQTQP